MSLKSLILATALTVASVGIASASPITGSFSLGSFGGAYVGGDNTAKTATGLDFGMASGGGGNGYGVNGTATVGNGMGDFVSLNGTLASIADISLGATANPYASNPFISFGKNSAISINFSNAPYTRSDLGTTVTVTGDATFTDGNPADTTFGTFSLATSSQNGKSSDVKFTFTSNASTNAVPEPVSMSILATGLVGAGLVRLRRRAA